MGGRCARWENQNEAHEGNRCANLRNDGYCSAFSTHISCNSAKRFAIFAGNGLSRSEAQKLVAHVKSVGVASDAYMVLQEWDADSEGPEEWELMR